LQGGKTDLVASTIKEIEADSAAGGDREDRFERVVPFQV